MERSLDTCLQETCTQPGVVGSILVDKHGLCLGAHGQVSVENAGTIAAIASQASKIEPDSKPPVIMLENNGNVCLIQQTEKATAAIFKVNQVQS